MNRVIFLLFVLVGSVAFSQGYYDITQEKFGQNRIQLRKLDWKTIQSNNFEFNFYRGGGELAQKAAAIAEGEYRKIAGVLGYTPFTTMKIFLYNNENQLKQSNIGLHSPILYDGGILNLSRSRIEIPYNGNDSLFHQQLVKEISSLFVYDMLYGGSLKQVLQSSLLLTVPEWFMNGISAYIAVESHTPEFNELARATILKNVDKKINSLTGDDATIIGQSIWNYIAVRYGRDNISNILNLTRIIRAEQSSITSTLGISFNRFLSEWKAFYMNGGQESALSQVDPKSPALQKSPVKINTTPKLDNLRLDEIDTEHYEFDEINVLNATKKIAENETEPSSTFNRNYLNKKTEELKISPTKSYQNLLLTQGLKTNFYNDPVRRLGMYNTLTVNDLLENHVIKFDLFVTPILKNHDIGVSYMNYEKRVDWGLSFKRRSIYFDRINAKDYYLFRPLNVSVSEASIIRRVFLHELNAHISYPLSTHLKVKFSPTVFFNNDVDYYDLSKKKRNSTYTGLKTEIVYDNSSQSIESGQLIGTRAKLAYQSNIRLLGDGQSFNQLYFDARHYQPLLRGLQLAGRYTYGTSTGKSPKYSFLGGMENTLNRSVFSDFGATSGESGDLRDIAFYNYPGNLRGFDFAKLFGTSYMLFNLELRFSLSSYLPKSAVMPSLIRNLQFVLFGDSGTAWNGNKGPWTRQNSLNTQAVGDGKPFYAVVTNFKNPFLFGYGGGIRTTILGFFIKADYGFGLENKEVNTGKFYLSLGHDF